MKTAKTGMSAKWQDRVAIAALLIFILSAIAAMPTTVQYPFTYDSVADMAAYHNPAGFFKSAYCRGYATPGDGGGGWFFATNSVTSTNIGTRIASRISGWSMDRPKGPIYANYFGAVPDYTGTQNTAGTGTDNRAAIQAALTYAYTQGGGGVNDTVNNISYPVVFMPGKYYVGARSDGMPSLQVPLKVTLDFGQAELHFEIPPTNNFGHSILEPNPAWCAILVGNQANVTIGKMQTVAGRDQTYGGAWYGLTLDGIRVVESDQNWIRGADREHGIMWFSRGAGIRYIACYNAFLSDVTIQSCAFGVIQSYYGNGFSAYTRYRSDTLANDICTSLWIDHLSLIGIYKKGIFCGVDGDYHTPATTSVDRGGLEYRTGAKVGGGPVSISHSAFESIWEESINVDCTSSLFMEDLRFERVGSYSTLGVITTTDTRNVKLNGAVWSQTGGTSFGASYTAATTVVTPQPTSFVYVNGTDVSPLLQNISINNTQDTTCRLVDGNNGFTRLPTVINYRTETSTQMQGTTSGYMKSQIIENDGGRTWSTGTVGLAPNETVNGTTTVFTFSNGFTRQKPRVIRADGLILPDTNSDGSTNWSWDSGTTAVTMTTAPSKDLRAFF